MKKLLLLLALSISSIASANTTSEINQKALSVLLAANPAAYDYNDNDATLLQAIAPYLLTTLDENNKGVMGTMVNECEVVSGIYECKLSIYNQDVVLNDNGDYAKPEDATESSVMVLYRVNKELTELTDQILLFYAG